MFELYDQPTGTLGGLFSQILSGEDLVRERAIKFLNSRLKLGSSDNLPKEVEDFIIDKTKEVGLLFIIYRMLS